MTAPDAPPDSFRHTQATHATPPRLPGTDGISILIATHNRSATLDRALQSLSLARMVPGVPVEAVVVANACSDDSVAIARAWAGRLAWELRCVEEPVPGLSVARNRAVRESRYPILAFLDDDVWIAPAWLESLVSTYRSTPADLVAGHVELWWEAVSRPDWIMPGMELVLSSLDLGPSVHEMIAPNAIGANFSFRRAVYDRIGPFRTELGRVGKSLAAGEESYFVGCAMREGFRLFYSPGASVKHWVAPERIAPEYLARATRSATMTSLLLAERLTPTHAIRALVGGCVRLAAHSVVGTLASLVGADSQAVRSRFERAVGQGRLMGVFRRWRDGPIIPANRPS